MSTWIALEEFASIVGKSGEEVKSLCRDGMLAFKDEDGRIYIDVGSGTQLVLRSTDAIADFESQSMGEMVHSSFAEKTIGTIIAFHERVLEAKEETLETLRRENKFLKEGLISMQEIYDEDRKTIDALTKQLEAAQEELEFTKRKYKLMWGQVVENHAK